MDLDPVNDQYTIQISVDFTDVVDPPSLHRNEPNKQVVLSRAADRQQKLYSVLRSQASKYYSNKGRVKSYVNGVVVRANDTMVIRK